LGVAPFGGGGVFFFRVWELVSRLERFFCLNFGLKTKKNHPQKKGGWCGFGWRKPTTPSLFIVKGERCFFKNKPPPTTTPTGGAFQKLGGTPLQVLFLLWRCSVVGVMKPPGSLWGGPNPPFEWGGVPPLFGGWGGGGFSFLKPNQGETHFFFFLQPWWGTPPVFLPFL